MAETNSHPRRVLRSVGAVGAGFLMVVILSLGTDMVLHSTGVFPPWGQATSDQLFVLATAYRTLFGVAGSYMTARLAPDRPMGHALAGGTIGLLICVAGAVATWNRGPAFGPHWYPLALVTTALPQSWVGAKLHEVQFLRAAW